MASLALNIPQPVVDSRMGTRPQGTRIDLQRSARTLDVRLPTKPLSMGGTIAASVFVVIFLAFGIGVSIFLRAGNAPSYAYLFVIAVFAMPLSMLLYLCVNAGDQLLHLDEQNLRVTTACGTKLGRTADVFRASVIYSHPSAGHNSPPRPTHVKIHVGVKEYVIGYGRLADTEAEWIVAEFNGLLQQLHSTETVAVGQPVLPYAHASAPPLAQPFQPSGRPADAVIQLPIVGEQPDKASMVNNWLAANHK